MFTYYSAPRLTTDTPDSVRSKLAAALLAVAGVEGVILKPATHQFEIKSGKTGEPRAAEVMAASRTAGFEAEARK